MVSTSATEERHTPDHIQLRWLLNSARLHTPSQEFKQCSQERESRPQREMRQTASRGSVWLRRLHPRYEKRKFSPRIRNWKPRDPATASQFQSTFKAKTVWLLQLQLPPLLVPMLILQFASSQFGQSWRVICSMLPLKSVVSSRTTSGNPKPGVVKWTGEWSYMREVCAVQSTQCPKEGRHDGGSQGGKNCLHYPLRAMVFSVSPNRWTAQTRALLVRPVYAMMLVSLRSLRKTGLRTVAWLALAH